MPPCLQMDDMTADPTPLLRSIKEQQERERQEQEQVGWVSKSCEGARRAFAKEQGVKAQSGARAGGWVIGTSTGGMCTSG